MVNYYLSICYHIILSINRVLSDSMTIETRFADLTVHNNDNSADKREVEIKVDAKYFSRMLGYGHCQPSNVICCIISL